MRQIFHRSLFWLGFFAVAALLMVRPVHAVTLHWNPSSGVSLGADGYTNLPAGSGSSLTNIPAYSLLESAPVGTTNSFRPTGTQFQANQWATVAWLYGTTYTANTDISSITANAAVRLYTAGDQVQLFVHAYNPTGSPLNRILVATSPVSTQAITETEQHIFGNFTLATSGTIPANYRMVLEVKAKLQNPAAGTPRFYYGGTTSLDTSFVQFIEAASTVTPVVPNPTTTDQTALLQEISNASSLISASSQLNADLAVIVGCSLCCFGGIRAGMA